MKRASFLALALSGVLINAGCAVYARPGEVAVDVAPPSPRAEVMVPAPAPGFVWVPGNWAWHDHWVWEPGRWARPPHARAEWEPDRWDHRGHRWVHVPGHWR